MGLGDLVGGQTGRVQGLRGIRRAAIETLDSIIRGGTDPDNEPVARSRERALRLVRCVHRLALQAVASINRNRHGWQAVRKLTLRRFRRVARVLSLVCQGESLECACLAAGFAWDARKQTSSGWLQAFSESGLRSALCAS